MFDHYESCERVWDPVKLAKAPSNFYWPFRDGTFIVVLFIRCSAVFHLQMVFFKQLCKFKIYSVKFGPPSCHPFGQGLPTLLAICPFCDCLIVFICLSL